MAKLSVNINKIATLRNSRGHDLPNVVQAAIDCERFGADGITVHPRPDERHITRQDVYDLKKTVTTEFNIEGYPSDSFIKMIEDVKPEQVTLVPDAHDVITSDQGWDAVKQKDFLRPVIAHFQALGCRVSVFVDPDERQAAAAAATGADRIELYTGTFARMYTTDPTKAIADYIAAANTAAAAGLAINAGHDLSLQNLKFFNKNIPFLAEVSIGHALISDALYYGLENTVQMYKRQLLLQ